MPGRRREPSSDALCLTGSDGTHHVCNMTALMQDMLQVRLYPVTIASLETAQMQ